MTDEDYLPVFIAEERFNEAILSKIENQKDRDFVRNNYVRFSLEKMPEGYERVVITNLNKDALFGEYTIMAETNVSGRQKADFIRHVLIQILACRNDVGSLTQIRPDMLPIYRQSTYVRKPNMLHGIWRIWRRSPAAGYTV